MSSPRPGITVTSRFSLGPLSGMVGTTVKILAIESIDDGFPSGFCSVIFFSFSPPPFSMSLRHKQTVAFHAFSVPTNRRLSPCLRSAVGQGYGSSVTHIRVHLFSVSLLPQTSPSFLHYPRPMPPMVHLRNSHPPPSRPIRCICSSPTLHPIYLFSLYMSYAR